MKLANKKRIIFVIYLILNLFLTINHEPWRDEIHPWLMDKYLNIFELFQESKFDGNPILWNLLLYPFVKLNFNIFVLNILSFIIVSISAYIFFFKIEKFPLWIKCFFLFTVPFTYVYSTISRNYCLLLLITILLAFFYEKRYNHPMIYSILIAFLIHTHVLAWGLVAGLTITFHILEIIKSIFKKAKTENFKFIIIGFIFIVINTFIILIEFTNNNNPDFQTHFDIQLIYGTFLIIFIIAIVIIFTFIRKTNYKEFFILFCSYIFMIFVYYTFYSSIIYQRQILIYVYLLFYLILITKNKNTQKNNFLNIIFVCFIFVFEFFTLITYETIDILYNFSSAKSISNYINQNLPQNSQILTISSIKTQTLEPYLTSCTQYDIIYNQPLTTGNVSSPQEYQKKQLSQWDIYKNNYIIVTEDDIVYLPENVILIYKSPICLINEQYFLYYIK